MNLSRIGLLPWKMQSESAKKLSTALATKLNRRIPRLYTEGGTYQPRPADVVINWGNSQVPGNWRQFHGFADIFINNPVNVAISANKLRTFQKFTEDPLMLGLFPDFTTSLEEAKSWVNQGILVVCRTKLSSHSGDGIIVAAREEDLPATCPLFVKYIKKVQEFRVHVAFGNVIDVQEKRKRTDYRGEINYAVRNHHTGWVYCREEIIEPASLRESATKAVRSIGLDFGAVDIIYNRHKNTCFVLEVNTAPGLEGTSVSIYVDAFYNHLTTEQ